LKEHASVDANSGFVLATTLTPASEHDLKYLPYLTIASCHTKDSINKVYADKGYYGEPNRNFLSLNEIRDGIMRKDPKRAKLTEYETERNKKISKKRYIAAPCGINLHRIEDPEKYYLNNREKTLIIA
jgi:IS5 family transposase